MPKVPINSRGSLELRQAIEAYQARRGMESFSDAVCALLVAGLSNSPATETPSPPETPVGGASTTIAQAILLLEARLKEQNIALQEVSRLLLSAVLPPEAEQARAEARRALIQIFGAEQG